MNIEILVATVGFIVSNFIYQAINSGNYREAIERSWFQGILGLTLSLIVETC